MKLKKITATVFILWIIAQVVAIVYFWGSPQYSDALAYSQKAYDCFEQGVWYPTPDQLQTEDYVFNPGYVNFLVLVLHIFGSLSVLPFINLLMNVGVVYLLYRIATTLFTQRIGYFSVILYCILISNILSSVVILSDLLYLFIVLGATALVRDKWWSLLLAGALLTLSNYVRPISVIFLIPIVIYMLAKHFNRVGYLALFGGAAIMFGSIVMFNKSINGTYIFAASTSGYNLVAGANDDANGTFTGEAFKEGGMGYIPADSGMSSVEKNEFWKERAIEWIKEHPSRYIALMPLKLARLWAGDDYHLNIFSPDLGHDKDTKTRVAELVLCSLTYYLVLVLAVVGLFRLGRKRLFSVEGLPLLPILACCAMHMLLYGGMRYHYPFMPCVILYAAFALNCVTGKNILKDD